MIKLENFEVVGWEHAIRGMRNPHNSWDRMDSEFGCRIDRSTDNVVGSYENGHVTHCKNCGWCDTLCDPTDPHDTKREYIVGENDHDRMMKLANGGPVHAKYRRMIGVYVDITAPLYWWKEFDTYKVGTVANSCSTMHKIHEKEFTLDDFSCEHLMMDEYYDHSGYIIEDTINALNYWRERYLIACKTEEETGLSAKDIWWQMIQLLPSSYNQKRTVYLSYEVLANIYEWRKDHKLDEWRELCKWIDSLPYSEIITEPVNAKSNVLEENKLLRETLISTQDKIEDLTNALKEANAIALERSKEIHALRKKLAEGPTGFIKY